MAPNRNRFSGFTVADNTKTNDLRIPQLPRSVAQIAGKGPIGGAAAHDEDMQGWRTDFERLLNERLSSINDSTTASDIAELKAEITALQADIAALKAANHSAPSAPETVDLTSINAELNDHETRLLALEVRITTLEELFEGHEQLSVSNLTPTTDQSVPAGYCAVVSGTFEIGSGLLLELGVDSVFDVL
jgi:uncharacterized small protein (DUF1192 family)